jgi:hypothetical protein
VCAFNVLGANTRNKLGAIFDGVKLAENSLEVRDICSYLAFLIWHNCVFRL